MFGNLAEKLYPLQRFCNKTTSFLFLIFSLIGIAVLIYSSSARKTDKAFFENAEPVTATICEIEKRETKDSDGNIKYEHHVYVDYEIDGQKYNNVYLCKYPGGMFEGDAVEAFYDPSNPTDIRIDYDIDQHYNDLAGVAIFFIVVGFLPMIITLMPKLIGDKNRGLMKTGNCVWATVKSIEADYHKTVNNEHPHWVVCEEVNEAEDTIYRYTSHKVYEYLFYRIQPGDRVAVYVDPTNPDKYYVNLDQIM